MYVIESGHDLLEIHFVKSFEFKEPAKWKPNDAVIHVTDDHKQAIKFETLKEAVFFTEFLNNYCNDDAYKFYVSGYNPLKEAVWTL